MEGCGKPQNLDNFAAMSREILQNGLRNWPNLPPKNYGLYSSAA